MPLWTPVRDAVDEHDGAAAEKHARRSGHRGPMPGAQGAVQENWIPPSIITDWPVM